VEIVVSIVAVLAVVGVFALVVSRRRRSRPRAPESVERRGTTPTTFAEPGRPVVLPAPDAQRVGLAGRIRSVFGAGVADPWSELEGLLVGADVGPVTSARIVGDVRERFGGGDDPSALVAQEIRTILGEPASIHLPQGRLGVVLVVGVNGSGKTTTIGKLAARHRAAGRSVLLGAGDTFRAAAREQLQRWGERTGCEVITGPDGGDPAAVAFDTVKAACARGADVAIIDTAGRLQTKVPLMEELAKIVRVVGKDLPGAPHETLLVLDANTGQNAISQAREFTSRAGVSGIVLTKLDGTAKGGVIVGLADELGLPVKYVGVGEGVEDLRDFSAAEFVDALFDA